MQQQSAELYQQHLHLTRERALGVCELCGYDWLLIYSGGLSYYFLDDQVVPYRPNPHWLHWLPVTDAPASLLWVNQREPLRVQLQVPDDYWNGPVELQPDYWRDSFDTEMLSAVPEPQLPAGARVAVIGDERALSQQFPKLVQRAEVNPEQLLLGLHYWRAFKTDYEVACLERATLLGARGHRAAGEAFVQGRSPWEIHCQYLCASGQDSRDTPYPNIIAMGRDAAVLHFQRYPERVPEPRTSLLIDAGATCVGYASDITRTWAVPGAFADLIAQFDRVQQCIVASVRPGSSFVDLQTQTYRKLAQWLVDVGIARASPEALVEQGVMNALMPHGVAHMLGLQVHDVGSRQDRAEDEETPKDERYPWLRGSRALAPSMVHTVEPGIYFIDVLLHRLRSGAAADALDWQQVEQLYPYGGIRIEDNVLVTETGARNLTRAELP